MDPEYVLLHVLSEIFSSTLPLLQAFGGISISMLVPGQLSKGRLSAIKVGVSLGQGEGDVPRPAYLQHLIRHLPTANVSLITYGTPPAVCPQLTIHQLRH